MKKKALLCITAAAVFVACSATAAFAAYVDADGDGLCDNRSLNQLQDGSGRPAGCGRFQQ